MAFVYFWAAASQGHPDAQNQFGSLLRQCAKGGENDVEALKVYRKS